MGDKFWARFFFWLKKVCLRLDSQKCAPSRWTIWRSVLLGREVFVTREPGKAIGEVFFGGGKSLEFLFFLG